MLLVNKKGKKKKKNFSVCPGVQAACRRDFGHLIGNEFLEKVEFLFAHVDADGKFKSCAQRSSRRIKNL